MKHTGEFSIKPKKNVRQNSRCGLSHNTGAVEPHIPKILTEMNEKLNNEQIRFTLFNFCIFELSGTLPFARIASICLFNFVTFDL